MNKTLPIVIDTISEVLKGAGQPVPAINSSSRILEDTGLDSLGLAEVVVKLEERLQKDPFKDEFIHFTTVEELARLYG